VNYWLTTHWPTFITEPPDSVEPGVWLQDGLEGAGRSLAAGDIVLVYQSTTGPALLETTASGQEVRRPRQRGRTGIVAVATALGPMRRVGDEIAHERYADGSERWWRWNAPLEFRSRAGFVPRAVVNEVLGYKPTYGFRGFGDLNSGLKKLTRAQHDDLIAAFLQTRTPLPAPEPAGHPHHGEGGPESEAHLALKMYVAANPAEVLGEEGLRTLAVEYEFPTQDRADIVLEDRFGCVIGLEVEVDCGPQHLAGILQAIKYRRMLEAVMRRPHNDGRAMLVAYSVCSEVRAVCSRYEVEVHAIPRHLVTESPAD
jgi:hypothetical protein